MFSETSFQVQYNRMPSGFLFSTCIIYIYIDIHVHTYMCIYIYIYIYVCVAVCAPVACVCVCPIVQVADPLGFKG